MRSIWPCSSIGRTKSRPILLPPIRMKTSHLLSVNMARCQAHHRTVVSGPRGWHQPKKKTKKNSTPPTKPPNLHTQTPTSPPPPHDPNKKFTRNEPHKKLKSRRRAGVYHCHPLSLTKIITTGIVPARSEHTHHFRHTMYPGNSGGPLFNARPGLIGLTTFGTARRSRPVLSGIVRIEMRLRCSSRIVTKLRATRRRVRSFPSSL